jgi:hypothetical protein
MAFNVKAMDKIEAEGLEGGLAPALTSSRSTL